MFCFKRPGTIRSADQHLQPHPALKMAGQCRYAVVCLHADDFLLTMLGPEAVGRRANGVVLACGNLLAEVLSMVC